MALKCKMIQRVEIKVSGDVFHDLYGKKPHHVSTIASDKIQGCDLHAGEFGNKDSILIWNYSHDGKARTAKTHIELIDEENKTIVFKILEGDLMELYKTFVLTFHVETKGSYDLVTWTFDYEKRNPNIGEPTDLMDFEVGLVKDIEAHHLKQQK